MRKLTRRGFLKVAGATSLALQAETVHPALAQPRDPRSLKGRASSEEVVAGPPVPTLVCQEFTKEFVPSYLSNGILGIRPGPNPLAQAQTLIGGFVYSHPRWGNESLAPAPYPLQTDIKVKEASVLTNSGLWQTRRQMLDMSSGELWTEMTVSPPGGPKLDLKVLQFCSRSVPGLLCQEIVITASADAYLEVVPAIGTKGIPGSVYLDRAPSPDSDPHELVWGFRNNRSKLGIALVVLAGSGLTRKAPQRYVVDARAGISYSFRTLAALVSEAYDPEPELQALRLVKWGEMLGFDRLRRANRDAWSELWRARVKVEADAETQKALDTALFYLHSAFHPSLRTGVAPYALSQYEALGGRVFWDMDSWCLPPIILASPAAARAALEFRLRGLAAARKRAALFGYEGAQFPWEATVEGFEGTPPFVATGWAEHHVVPDVALAFWQYQLATDDPVFLREATWPVLKAVARWIESRGISTPRGFEILNVMGVDESLPNTNNNSYMNLACKMVMQAATECARSLAIPTPPAWEKIAQSFVIPLDKAKQVVIPYDDAKLGPQYSVGMLQYLFLHSLPISIDLFRNTFEFEEQLRVALPHTGSNPCSPKAPGFSCPPFAACAGFFGDRRKAAALFWNSWKPYWAEPYGLTKEYQFFSDGNYVTNNGSLLRAAMFGFTGLRISDGDWRRYPASLPEGWQRIEIDRIWVRGKPKKLIAEHGKLALLLDL